MNALDLAVALGGVPAAAGGAYLAVLAACARRRDLAGVAMPAGAPLPVFDVIVPAHDEAAGIAATVASLRGLDYPRDRFRVIVVADNCTDDTAQRARAAGAVVRERHDPARRGKGYALALAYQASIADGIADAVAVVDADTLVAPNLLRAFAARIASGAECAQAEYGVRNAGASWRTRLMRLAFTLYHTVRSLGRERLGCSAGLRGNGMAFTVELLRRVPHEAFSLVEDVEYGLTLGLRGIRVWYVPEATVLGDMPEGGDGARTQRERWERGRRDLVRRRLPELLRAVPRLGRVPLDLAADLLVPPLTTLAGAATLGTVTAALFWRSDVVGTLALAPWLVAMLGLVVYVARGCALSGGGARVLLDLCWAPVYAVWKLTLRLPSRHRAAPGEWVRTRRAGEAPHHP